MSNSLVDLWSVRSPHKKWKEPCHSVTAAEFIWYEMVTIEGLNDLLDMKFLNSGILDMWHYCFWKDG